MPPSVAVLSFPASPSHSGADMRRGRVFAPQSVSSYEEAQAWLWGHSRVEEWLFDPDAVLPPEAMLVCAVYWVSPAQLSRDLRKTWNQVAG